ncbi:tetratricopeptide repeat protein [Pseudonocardia kunmingensis]|nr:tetratricopeptide repeat protein [Pseudonocardia kunmingensis]
MYRHDRLPGGSHYVRRTTWEDEAAGALVGGAASATGWLIGSGISGIRTLARNSQDRRLVRAATALEEASESEDDDQFLALATDFTRRYPQLEDGHAALALALQRKGQFDAAIRSLDRAIQVGLDETQAHMIRADIYDDANKPGKAIQEFTMLTQAQIPELRQISLLSRARLLIQIGDLDQALKDANDAIATLPDESAYILRGHVHRRNGDLESCLQDYSRAIQLCLESPDFLSERADVYEMLGNAEEAENDRAAARARSMASADASVTGEPPDPVSPPAARTATSPQHKTVAHPKERKVWVWVACTTLLATALLLGAILTFAGTGASSVSRGDPGLSINSAPPSQVSADPQTQLQQLRAADDPNVERLIGYWVPQLSAKKPGLVAEGQAFSPADVLADHMVLRSTYPGALLLWSGDYPSYRNGDFWITVVNQPSSTPKEANSWCDAQGIRPDDCFAKKISRTGDSMGTTAYR